MASQSDERCPDRSGGQDMRSRRYTSAVDELRLFDAPVVWRWLRMFCPNCGKELSNDARFCLRCGAQVQVGDAVANQSRQPTKSSQGPGLQRILVIVAVFLVVGIAALTGAILAQRQGGSADATAKASTDDSDKKDEQESDASEQAAAKEDKEGEAAPGSASADAQASQTPYDPTQFTFTETTFETMDFIVTVPAEWEGIWEHGTASKQSFGYNWLFSVQDSTAAPGFVGDGICVTSNPNKPSAGGVTERVFDEPSSNGMYLWYVAGDPQGFFEAHGGKATITLK